MQLIDVGLTVDTSGLENRLDEIEAKLNQDGTIEDIVERKLGERLSGEVTVQIQSMVEHGDLPGNDHTHEDVDEERVQEIFRDMAHDEGEDMVQRIIDGYDFVTADDLNQRLGDYVTDDDLSTKIDDALDDRDYVTSQDVRDIISEEGLDTDSVADADDVDRLKDRVTDLERRLEVYANRADEAKGLAERVATIEERMGTALTFFGLIQQAFNLLMQGRRG